MLRLRRGTKKVEVKSLRPLCNINDLNSFSFEADTVRFNIFAAMLTPHKHPDEDGLLVFLVPSPEAHIKGKIGQVEPGEGYEFGVDDVHGFLGGGKAIVFHGYEPFTKDNDYEILEASYVPHPEGGESVVVRYSIGRVEQPIISYTPDSHMSLGAALRTLDQEIRKSRGERYETGE